MGRSAKILTRGLVLAGALLGAVPADAAEKIVVGVTGTPNALAWPFYIAIEKGERPAKPDEIVIVNTNAKNERVTLRVDSNNPQSATVWQLHQTTPVAEPPVKKPRLALLVVAVPPAPERPLAHSQKLGGSPWLSSADSHRCKTFKNIAMRTP